MFLHLFAVLLIILTFTASAIAGAGKPEEEPADKEAFMVTYRTIDVPFADSGFTIVTGKDQDRLIGVYTDALNNQHGFVRLGPKRWEMLPFLTVQDVSAAGLTGWRITPGAAPDGGAITASYLIHDGTFERIQVPRVGGPGVPANTLTEAISVNDAGLVVGDFRRRADGKFLGFTYDSATQTYTTLDAPGTPSLGDPLSTAALWISPAGRILVRGVYAGGVIQHYLWDTGVFTPLDIPGFPNANIVARTDAGIVAGNIGTTGFVWDGHDLQVIEFPDAPGADVVLTELFGMHEDRAVYGRYVLLADGSQHGFIARLQGKHLVARRSKRMEAPFTEADCVACSKHPLCVEMRRAAALEARAD